MALHRGTVHVFAWHEVAFPLWQEPRPPFEAFVEADLILQQSIPWSIRSNYVVLQDSGNRKDWLRWTFDGPVSEEVRLRIQKAFAEYYGEAAASHFRWEGARAKTIIEQLCALGEHVQGGTEPC